MLSKSVVDAWNEYLSPKTFVNVHGRIRVVLVCIVEGGGGNELVESKRGKLFQDATLEEVVVGDNDVEHNEDLDCDLDDMDNYGYL